MIKNMLICGVSLLLISGGANAGNAYYGCQKKLFNLEKQLDYAYAYHNVYRARGLERAIARVKAYCHTGNRPSYDGYTGATYDGYTGATNLHRYKDGYSLRKKIAKAELELKEAEMKGDPLKIAKRKGKVELLKEELRIVENNAYAFSRAGEDE